ncbi:hypothetical protein AVEN_169822-1, partial [Araneus ventricosus]
MYAPTLIADSMFDVSTEHQRYQKPFESDRALSNKDE